MSADFLGRSMPPSPYLQHRIYSNPDSRAEPFFGAFPRHR
jgi:hypothetical protein